ncbi:MAG: AAA family ATPase [Ilumatobacteraceae bacterium]
MTRSFNQLREFGDRGSETSESPPHVLHTVAILGELGKYTSIESIISSSFFDDRIEFRQVAFESVLTNEIDLTANELLEGKPTAIFIGSDIPTIFAFGLARRLLLVSAPTEVVLVTTTSAENWALAALIGIHNIVDPESGESDFISAIGVSVDRGARMRAHFDVNSPAVTKRGRLIAVLSPKGGSGKTTIAVNVATALAQAAPNRTLLIDFDCQFGDVATALGLSPERTLTDLGNVTRLDATSVKLFMTRDSTGSLLVLPSSSSPEEADLIDKTLAEELLDIMLYEFDYIVVDTAAGIDERSLAAISCATDLVFIANMDVPSVRNLIKELQLLDRLGKPGQTRHFVLNRVTKDSGLEIDDIVEAVGIPITNNLAMSSLLPQRLNSGRAVVLSDPKSSESKSLVSLAHKLLTPDDLASLIASKRRRWRRS